MKHKRAGKLPSLDPNAISWDRAAAIFGNPKPPQAVTERQFDYMDDDLERIAKTPYEQFDFNDLWYYHHDLAYVPLQPDLFCYLFPVCLMDWHDTLMKNADCSHGDSEFHRSLHHGNVFEKMLTPQQRHDVFEFFRDSFLIRVDGESVSGELSAESMYYSERWLFRFNSLAMVMPQIEIVWDPWWSCTTLGRAVSMLKYSSLLMYFEWQRNPLFKEYPGPPIWQNDSQLYHAGWRDENLRFLRNRLTVDYVHDRITAAAQQLMGQPEQVLAEELILDWPKCRDLVAARIEELPTLLKEDGDEWTV